MKEKIKLAQSILVLIDLVAIWEHEGCYEGAPDHGHRIPGIWDKRNGELSGKPCAECATYNEARRIVANLKSMDAALVRENGKSGVYAIRVGAE